MVAVLCAVRLGLTDQRHLFACFLLYPGEQSDRWRPPSTPGSRHGRRERHQHFHHPGAPGSQRIPLFPADLYVNQYLSHRHAHAPHHHHQVHPWTQHRHCRGPAGDLCDQYLQYGRAYVQPGHLFRHPDVLLGFRHRRALSWLLLHRPLGRESPLCGIGVDHPIWSDFFGQLAPDLDLSLRLPGELLHGGQYFRHQLQYRQQPGPMLEHQCGGGGLEHRFGHVEHRQFYQCQLFHAAAYQYPH